MGLPMGLPSSLTSVRIHFEIDHSIRSFVTLQMSSEVAVKVADGHDAMKSANRKIVCGFYARGECQYGLSCMFSHDLSDGDYVSNQQI